MIRNEKGFALGMTMALLPFLLAGFFLAWASVGFIQQDLALKYACRKEGLEGQKKVAPQLKKLLSLNPKAKKLREDLQNAVDKLKAAAAKKNAAGVTYWLLKVEEISLKRMELDFQQRKLISESNRLLSNYHRNGENQIRIAARSTSSAFIDLKMNSIIGQTPKLAVRPDYPDTAPTYSPTFDFANEQALAHEWQYTATIAQPFSHFLPGQFTFKKACAVTLKKDVTEWIPQITKARYSLKSVW